MENILIFYLFWDLGLRNLELELRFLSLGIRNQGYFGWKKMRRLSIAWDSIMMVCRRWFVDWKNGIRMILSSEGILVKIKIPPMKRRTKTMRFVLKHLMGW